MPSSRRGRGRTGRLALCKRIHEAHATLTSTRSARDWEAPAARSEHQGFPGRLALYFLVADQPVPVMVSPSTRPVYLRFPAVKRIDAPLSLPAVIGVEPRVPEIT